MISKVFLSCGFSVLFTFLGCGLDQISAVNLRFVADKGLRLELFLRFRLKDKRTDSDSFVVLLLRLKIPAVKHFCGFNQTPFLRFNLS